MLRRTIHATLRVVLVTALGALPAGCCKRSEPDPAAEAERQFRGELARLSLPVAKHASAWIDAPVVRLQGPAVTVDGSPAGQLGAENGTLELRTMLRNKRQLWEQLNPGSRFPGTVLLAASRDTDGEKVAAVAGAALQAGFPNLRIVVHAADKGEPSPDNLGVVELNLRALRPGDPSASQDGAQLTLGPADMAVLSWRKGAGETGPEPVAMTEEKRADATVRLPGLESAIGRATAAHEGERLVASVLGMDRVSLAKLVGIADVFGDPGKRYEVTWMVVPR